MAELENGEAPAPKKSNKKLLFLIAGAVVLVGGVVGALFAFGVIGGKGHAKTETGSADPAKAAKAVEPTKALPTLQLDPFVVNLADEDQGRFLKVTVEIELSSPTLTVAVEQHKSRIRDSIITLLSSKTLAQIRDSKGKLKLKQEITLRLNEILGTNAITDILFTEFIIS